MAFDCYVNHESKVHKQYISEMHILNLQSCCKPVHLFMAFPTVAYDIVALPYSQQKTLKAMEIGMSSYISLVILKLLIYDSLWKSLSLFKAALSTALKLFARALPP